jgi:hypothetical protein
VRLAYTVIFLKNATPPVNGFWSLTLYNRYHLCGRATVRARDKERG